MTPTPTSASAMPLALSAMPTAKRAQHRADPQISHRRSADSHYPRAHSAARAARWARYFCIMLCENTSDSAHRAAYDARRQQREHECRRLSEYQSGGHERCDGGRLPQQQAAPFRRLPSSEATASPCARPRRTAKSAGCPRPAPPLRNPFSPSQTVRADIQHIPRQTGERSAARKARASRLPRRLSRASATGYCAAARPRTLASFAISAAGSVPPVRASVSGSAAAWRRHIRWRAPNTLCPRRRPFIR